MSGAGTYLYIGLLLLLLLLLLPCSRARTQSPALRLRAAPPACGLGFKQWWPLARRLRLNLVQLGGAS